MGISKRGLVCALVLALVSATGCRRRDPIRSGRTEEETPRLASAVHMADARAATQLENGFYDVEQGAWRWTASRFAVTLRPPRGAAQKGATLTLKFVIPEAAMAKLHTISMSASVSGAPLPPETYTQGGEFVFVRDVPAKLLQGESVKVEFSLDKWLPPNDSDHRELGVIATMAGLEAK